MRRSRLLPLGIAAMVAACASAGGGPVQLLAPYLDGTLEPHRTELSASLERVGGVIPEAYELMGLPVSLDEEMGEYTWTTPELEIDGPLYQGELNSDYIDCGMSDEGPRADVYSVEFAVLTRLIPGPSVTSVETVLSGVAADPAGPAMCTGTGKLERDIARVLRLRAPR